MADRTLESLLEQRVNRAPSDPVSRSTVDHWIAIFGSRFPIVVAPGLPPMMATTFVRSPVKPMPGESPATGVVLHDQLKEAMDLPVAIAIGYELELLGDLREGDRLLSEERIAHVGSERSMRLGSGREWIIEVVTSTTDGPVVCIERFRMMGYRPGAGVRRSDSVRSELPAFAWSEELSIDADLIIDWASAHRVWAPAHHDPDTARAVGLPDIILDTSSQVSLFAGAAHRHRPEERILRVELEMRRPILPGATLVIGGIDSGSATKVSATVDGRVVSKAIITFTG